MTNTSNNLHRLDIHVPIDAVDVLMERLEFLCESMTASQDGSHWVLSLYQQTSFNLDEINDCVTEIAKILDFSAPQLSPQIIENKDWVKESQAQFTPIEVGNFYIHASWHPRADEDANLIQLEIDPESSFGTGKHETTFGCLEALTKLAKDTSYQPKIIHDLGCGSGILAIAAKKLFNNLTTYASDNDPNCIITTTTNANKNLTNNDIITYATGGYESFNDTHINTIDLTIANILLEPLLKLADDIASYGNTPHTLIASGILTHQAQTLIDCYKKLNYEPIDLTEYGEWSVVTLTRS